MCTTFLCQVNRKIKRSYKINAKCVTANLVNNARRMFLFEIYNIFRHRRHETWKKGPKHNFSMQILHENWKEEWNFANLNHFGAGGSKDARSEPKILKWSLWVTIDLAWKDELIDLHNDNLALLSVACTRLHPALSVRPSIRSSVIWSIGLSVHYTYIFYQFYFFKSFLSMSHFKSFQVNLQVSDRTLGVGLVSGRICHFRFR